MAGLLFLKESDGEWKLYAFFKYRADAAEYAIRVYPD